MKFRTSYFLTVVSFVHFHSGFRVRAILALMMLFVSALAISQNFTYPAVNQKGEKLSDFVPAGWTILDSAIGDLNRDGAIDAAIVLQLQDSVKLTKAEDDTVITQPRMLLVLFKDAYLKQFFVKERSNSFILPHDNPQMEDPYQELVISKGVLQIKFHFFYYMVS